MVDFTTLGRAISATTLHYPTIMNSPPGPSSSPPTYFGFKPASAASSPQQPATGYFDQHVPLPSKVRASDASIFSPSHANNAIVQRVDSFSSDVSILDSPSMPCRKTSSSWIKPSPTVNVHTTCGRHTDQMLFSGPSLAEMARAMMGKKK